MGNLAACRAVQGPHRVSTVSVPGAAACRRGPACGINEQLITVVKRYSARGRQHTYIYQFLISSSCLADSCLSARRRDGARGLRGVHFLAAIKDR